MKHLTYLILFLILISCKSNKNCDNQINDWRILKRCTKTIGNITYTFPASIKKDDRINYINICSAAMKDNLSIIGETTFNDTIDIEFLETRDQMKKYIGMGASGIAFPDRKTMFVITNETNPPIQHELMHMIVMLKWGYPHETSKWINEGFATFSAGECNGFTVEEIYAYLLRNDMLISMSNLSKDFYSNPEMIAYHQCGYLIEYLKDKYGIGLLKQLWNEGMDNFKKIYKKSFDEILKEINEKIDYKYPETPLINWNEFKKGCD